MDKLDPERVNRDISIVRNRARFLIEITDEGTKILTNKEWTLNIIAVLGPAEKEGEIIFKEAVLLEIGIGRTRPYARTKIAQNDARKKIFFLTKEQYLAIRPALFWIFLSSSADRMKNWKKLTVGVKKKKVYFSNRGRYCSKEKMKKNVLIVEGWEMESLKGVRFSVSKRDEYLLSDIFNLELKKNPSIERKLKGISGMIYYSLKRYVDKFRSPSELNSRVKFDSSGINAVVETLKNSNPLPHHLQYILSYKKMKKKELFLSIASYVLGEDRWVLEREVIQAGEGMSLMVGRDPLGLQIRTIKEKCYYKKSAEKKKRKMKKREFVVFEVAIPELVERRKQNEKRE